jgi:hypothetical protein
LAVFWEDWFWITVSLGEIQSRQLLKDKINLRGFQKDGWKSVTTKFFEENLFCAKNRFARLGLYYAHSISDIKTGEQIP